MMVTLSVGLEHNLVVTLPVIYCKYVEYRITATIASHDSTTLARNDIPDPNSAISTARYTSQVHELYTQNLPEITSEMSIMPRCQCICKQ